MEASPAFVEQRRTRVALAGGARHGVVQVRVPNPLVPRTDLSSYGMNALVIEGIADM